jgi:hypothetical protein
MPGPENTSPKAAARLSRRREGQVPIAIGLVVLLAALCISGIMMWRRLAASSIRIIGTPEAELRDLFLGGVMCRHVITSGSLARLEFYDWGIRLRGTVISRWIVPTWEARFDEMAIAELVALPASRIAVCFRLRRAAEPVPDASRADPRTIAFLSYRSLEILALLEKRGVPVSRAVTRIRRVEELYR